MPASAHFGLPAVLLVHNVLGCAARSPAVSPVSFDLALRILRDRSNLPYIIQSHTPALPRWPVRLCLIFALPLVLTFSTTSSRGTCPTTHKGCAAPFLTTTPYEMHGCNPPLRPPYPCPPGPATRPCLFWALVQRHLRMNHASPNAFCLLWLFRAHHNPACLLSPVASAYFTVPASALFCHSLSTTLGPASHCRAPPQCSSPFFRSTSIYLHNRTLSNG